MIQPPLRRRARAVTLTLAMLAILSLTLVIGGVVHAAPTTPAISHGSHANQQWFGPSCGNGCGIYLG